MGVKTRNWAHPPSNGGVQDSRKEAAVHVVSDDLPLHRGVHDHTLKIFGLDGLNVDSHLDGGLGQLLHPLLAQGASEAANLRRVLQASPLRPRIHRRQPQLDEFP